MNKKCKIIIVLILLFRIGVFNAYSTSVVRMTWAQLIYTNHFSACHLGTFSEFVTDSTALFDIMQSSKKGLKKITINHKKFREKLEKNVFYVFMTSDSTNFVFGFDTEDKNEAYEMFNRLKEIERIEKLTNIDRKIKQYKKWLFSLCESKYKKLRYEGYNEWEYGRVGLVQQYAQIHGLFDESGYYASQEGWDRVFIEQDYRRFLNILLKIEYPTYQEWSQLNSLRHKYTPEVKSYVYSYFKRYSENFDKNFKEIQHLEIQTSTAFIILKYTETNEKILEILSEYENEGDKKYYSQERWILETYINPIIEQIDKNLK